MIRTVIDFESAYGKHPVTQENITLSKITSEAYVRHPLFKIHGLGVKIEQDSAFYLYGADLLHFLKTHPWDRTFAIGHHSAFDGAILTWRLGIRPAFWGDTLSMARAVYPYEASSLSNIAKVLGVGEKGFELANFAGKWSLTDQEQAVLGSYCKNDVELTARIFDALKGHFSVSELRLIDLTVRMFTEPVLEVDREVLIEEYKRERRTKRALLKACATDKSVLASGDQFAALLLTLGVDPPKKLSPSKVKDGRVNPDTAGEAPLGLLPSFTAKKGTSAEERLQLKEEKNTYPWAYAFGKSDEEFKLLLDHPDEQIRAVVEARLGVKSTIKETRSKRFYKIGSRGAFPVYHNYYGAKTGRDSGGDRQNTTNLNRVNPKDPTSGALRRSLLAPLGYALVVRDLGQIEARKLAYWAGQEDLLHLFRVGGDPYNRQASKIFGYEVDRKLEQFYLEGLVGKASVLGCFAGDTKVLTNRGWVDIVSITGTDTVWDGTEFVNHAGVIPQGEKRCLTAFGVTATPDHEILTEHSWEEWQSVLTNRFLFRSAIRRGSLLFRSGETENEERVQCGTPGSSVHAVGSGLFPERTSKAGAPTDVISVLKKLLELLSRSIAGMLPSFRMITTASGCLTEYPPASNGVTIPPTGSLCIMGGEVSMYAKNGGLTEQNSFGMLSRSLGGMLPTLNLTGKTMTRGMNQEISGSLRGQKTQETGDPWEHLGKNSSISEKRTLTYDIACAGPRSRFTILTTEGPLIVHNCGYGMGWSKFQESLRIGFLGSPPLLFDQEAAAKLGADVDVFCHTRSYRKGCATLREEALMLKPLSMSEEAHLWHCAAVKQIVDKYRESNEAIVRLWREAGQSLEAIVVGDEIQVGQRGLIFTCAEGFLLPNGMKIRYHKLRKNDAGEYRYLANVRRKDWAYIYSGKCVENCVQALSRIVLTDQMLKIDSQLKTWAVRDPGKIYKIVTTTYDEVVCCVPEYRAQECLDMMEREMATAPAWCPDLPLKSSGGYARSYGECEK